MMGVGIHQRTIVAAMNPWRFKDSYTEIFMKVWFYELGGDPVEFCASPFDCERHGKELWIRAMGGEYGPIEVVDESSPLTQLENRHRTRSLEAQVIDAPRLLEYHARTDA